jgi:hypothetical protein
MPIESMVRLCPAPMGHFAKCSIVVIVIVVLFVVPVAVLGVDDHFFVLTVLLMMRVVGLSVNPAGLR